MNRKKSIKWYGHVIRMQDYRKPKQDMEARREKRRGRGRPRRTWEDCVIDVARRKGKTLADLKRKEEVEDLEDCVMDVTRRKGKT